MCNMDDFNATTRRLSLDGVKTATKRMSLDGFKAATRRLSSLTEAVINVEALREIIALERYLISYYFNFQVFVLNNK